MTQGTSSPFNPAAVLVHSMYRVGASGTSQHGTTTFKAGRRSDARTLMDMELHTTDQNLWRHVLNLPTLGARLAIIGASPSDVGFRELEVPYDEMLELAGCLYRQGLTFDSALAHEQAKAAATAPELASVRAQALFTLQATTFLQQIEAMQLPELNTRKGIRQVDNPCRAVALAHYNDCVAVSPDPQSERYVHVRVRLPLQHHATVRDMAFDYYETLGQRVLLSFA